MYIYRSSDTNINSKSSQNSNHLCDRTVIYRTTKRREYPYVFLFPFRSDSVGCSRSHVHNGASHVHRVRVRFYGH